MTTTALVLDAGGARSGYQVGVLQVLLPALVEADARPRLLVGSSAGALISAALASTAHLPVRVQVQQLSALLGHMTKPRVMRPLWQQVPEVMLRYASETVGWSGFRLRGLFGTAPLASTLATHVDWDRLHRNLDGGRVDTLAVTATSVRTGRVVIFTEGAERLPSLPSEQHRHYVRARLDTDHLMASAAVPALFPSVRLDDPPAAAGWYVDGATRRRAPLVPALELGADRVVAIGTGRLHAPEPDPSADRAPVDLADSAATLLGAVMDDPLRHDLRRLREINALAADDRARDVLTDARAARSKGPVRVVPHVGIAPRDGAAMADAALATYRRNHGSLRALGDPDLHLMHRLLGSDSPLQGELLSYLMFDPDFFAAAGELGREDARTWLREHPELFAT